MLLYQLFPLAVIVAQTSAAPNTAVKTQLNGWYNCSAITFSDEGSSFGLQAECATFKVPLCYPGICETPQFADPTVDIFVKRILASNGDPKTATNVWLLPGGPGYSSSGLESSIPDLLVQLDSAANIYMMDHRGTGRSTFLDCIAAQATTTGSPNGREFDPSEVPACAHELENEYGSLASFSVTSAAIDLVTFISKYSNGASTILYGESYGTILVERAMQLNPPEVTGYVLDGIATTSRSSSDKFNFASKWDANFGIVGNRFMELCSQDAVCSSRFKAPSTLAHTLRGLQADFDKDPNSTCASLMGSVKSKAKVFGDFLPASSLSTTLGTMLMDSELRKLIPPLVYRLKRCEANDVDVLSYFINSFNAYSGATVQDDTLYSPLLYYLIVFSEMWESPQPSMIEMERRFKTALMSDDTPIQVPLYCAFSKEKSKVCSEFNYGKYAASRITYDRDEYWNKTAKIPSHASVLLLSSRLDPQTPHEYAETLLEMLDGDEKELVTFNTSVHVALMSTQLDPTGGGWSSTCGAKILASYVGNNGELKGLDKSCVNDMPAFNFTVPIDYLISYFNTDDVYDGTLNSNPSPM